MYIGTEQSQAVINNRNHNIKSMCNLAFGENHGKDTYNFVRDSRIIEQQLILSILENEKDDNYISDIIKKKNINEVLDMYFDRQLCCTGYYFEAMQILYLLSIGRNRSYNIDQIEMALFNSRHQNDIVKTCMNSLKEMNIVKHPHKDSDRFEIVHDYIADKALEYCNRNLPADVQTVIQLYHDNYNNKKFNAQVNQIIQNKSNNAIGWQIALISVELLIIGQFVYHRYFLEQIDYSMCIPVAALISVIYGYGLYMNIMRLHPSKHRRILHAACITIFPGIFVLIGTECYSFSPFIYFGIAICFVGIGL